MSAAQRAADGAQAARAESGRRLADAERAVSEAQQQAEHERNTIIRDLREMRRRNNLARMILDSAGTRGPVRDPGTSDH